MSVDESKRQTDAYNEITKNPGKTRDLGEKF